MNLELLDPFAKTVPDHVDSTLSYGVEDATVCTFDKRGTYLAVGYSTGVVVIWDFITRGIGRVIEAHGRGVTALSWARGSRQLLSASHDHRLHLWSLEAPRPELMRVMCLSSPIMSALMCPGAPTKALALTAAGIVYVVDLQKSTSVPLLSTRELSPPTPRSTGPSTLEKSTTSGETSCASKPSAVLCMSVDRRARSVVCGTADGRVIVVKSSTSRVSRSYAVTGCSKVKQLDFSRDGKWMLVHGGERVIRMLQREGTTGRSVRDFQDVVNRTRWRSCRFTGDSEYVAGGSRAEATCSIYIWTVGGHLVTRLEGPQMGLLSLTRHPVRPFLAAALTNGKVQLWGTTHTANWTAFAADFEELEENVEYIEKEDEFDIVVDSQDPEGKKRKAEEEQEMEETVVSIEAIDTVGAWSSDSEGDEGGPFYLSTEPGAAAQEGWYDLEVQAAKRGYSEKDAAEEWTSVRAHPSDVSHDRRVSGAKRSSSGGGGKSSKKGGAGSGGAGKGGSHRQHGGIKHGPSPRHSNGIVSNHHGDNEKSIGDSSGGVSGASEQGRPGGQSSAS